MLEETTLNAKFQVDILAEKQKGYQTLRTLRTFSFFFLCGLRDVAESVSW